MAHFVLTPKDTADAIVGIWENRHKWFGGIVIFAVLILIAQYCEHVSRKKQDRINREKGYLTEIVKNSEEIFKIENQDRKLYQVNSAEDISRINDLVGLQNCQTGFYAGKKHPFSIDKIVEFSNNAEIVVVIEYVRRKCEK